MIGGLMREDETDFVTLCFLHLKTEEIIFAFRASRMALSHLEKDYKVCTWCGDGWRWTEVQSVFCADLNMSVNTAG